MVSTKLGGLLVLLLAAVVILEVAWMGVHLRRGAALAAASERFERRLPQAPRRLLVIGDSTGVGTGAGDPGASVAGRLAARFEALGVTNLAVNGARMTDLPAQLAAAPPGPYDAVLIQVGGNDILRFTPLDTLRRQTLRVLDGAGVRGGHVVMMSTGAVGSAPAFLPPLSWILSARSRDVRALFLQVAAAAGVEYVDLYRPPGKDPFRTAPARYYAADGLHPSGAGYGLWLDELLAQSAIAQTLGAGGGAPGHRRGGG